MQCSNCGQENPDGMKFCGECGTPLKNRCPQCGFENLQSAFHNPQLEAGECFLKAIEVVQRQQQATQQGSRNTYPARCSTRHVVWDSPLLRWQNLKNREDRDRARDSQ